MKRFDNSIIEDFRLKLVDFFGVDVRDTPIFVCDEVEFSPFKYDSYIVAMTVYLPKAPAIFILEQSVSGRDYDAWLNVIKHELVHVFYYSKNHVGLPKWLNEGLAMILSGQKMVGTSFTIQDLMKYADKMDERGYGVGYSAVSELMMLDKDGRLGL